MKDVIGTSSSSPLDIDHALGAQGIFDRDISIKYRFEKSLENPRTFVIGGQYQMNKHFQIKTEFGIAGTKRQIVLSTNYRFGILKKK